MDQQYQLTTPDGRVVDEILDYFTGFGFIRSDQLVVRCVIEDDPIMHVWYADDLQLVPA